MEDDRINLTGHPCIKNANIIRKICKPLFQTFPISCFRYLKVFNDNSRVVLCTNPENTKYVYEKGNYKYMWYDCTSPLIQNAGWRAWQLNRTLDKRQIHQKIDTELKILFNLSHGLTYIRKTSSFFETYAFDTDDSLVYTCDLSELIRFIYYFKSEANEIIANLENEKIVIPNSISL